ncbi:MAG: uroporphyrinogen-III C-methyltransferase [Candidatus Acidiferrales bacterium]
MKRNSAGKVYLVGAGPGDPDLLTVKASALLRIADIILHDDLVPAEILALAGPRAFVVNVGKRCGTKKITQAEIHERMIASSRQGFTVVRLKSGDPAIFGRLAEEIDALEEAGIRFEIVPGVTAGVAAAASLGVSLTDRRKSSRILIVSGHHAEEKEREEKSDWSGLVGEDTTLVVYMPGNNFSRLREELLAAGLAPETPSVVVSHATTPAQEQRFTTLGELHTVRTMETPAILLIGRSLERASQRIGKGNLSGTFDETSWKLLLERVELEVATATAQNEHPERRIHP